MFNARMRGEAIPDIARRYGVTSRAVKQAVDERLPRMDEESLARTRREALARLEELTATFQRKALDDLDVASAQIVIKAIERLSDMCGLDAPKTQTIDMRANQPQKPELTAAWLRERVEALRKDRSGENAYTVRDGVPVPCAPYRTGAPRPDTETPPPPYDGLD